MSLFNRGLGLVATATGVVLLGAAATYLAGDFQALPAGVTGLPSFFSHAASHATLPKINYGGLIDVSHMDHAGQAWWGAAKEVGPRVGAALIPGVPGYLAARVGLPMLRRG